MDNSLSLIDYDYKLNNVYLRNYFSNICKDKSFNANDKKKFIQPIVFNIDFRHFLLFTFNKRINDLMLAQTKEDINIIFKKQSLNINLKLITMMFLIMKQIKSYILYCKPFYFFPILNIITGFGEPVFQRTISKTYKQNRNYSKVFINKDYGKISTARLENNINFLIQAIQKTIKYIIQDTLKIALVNIININNTADEDFLLHYFSNKIYHDNSICNDTSINKALGYIRNNINKNVILLPTFNVIVSHDKDIIQTLKFPNTIYISPIDYKIVTPISGFKKFHINGDQESNDNNNTDNINNINIILPSPSTILLTLSILGDKVDGIEKISKRYLSRVNYKSFAKDLIEIYNKSNIQIDLFNNLLLVLPTITDIRLIEFLINNYDNINTEEELKTFLIKDVFNYLKTNNRLIQLNETMHIVNHDISYNNIHYHFIITSVLYSLLFKIYKAKLIKFVKTHKLLFFPRHLIINDKFRMLYNSLALHYIEYDKHINTHTKNKLKTIINIINPTTMTSNTIKDSILKSIIKQFETNVKLVDFEYIIDNIGARFYYETIRPQLNANDITLELVKQILNNTNKYITLNPEKLRDTIGLSILNIIKKIS